MRRESRFVNDRAGMFVALCYCCSPEDLPGGRDDNDDDDDNDVFQGQEEQRHL